MTSSARHAIDDIFAIRSFEQCLEVTAWSDRIHFHNAVNSSLLCGSLSRCAVCRSAFEITAHSCKSEKPMLGLPNYHVPSTVKTQRKKSEKIHATNKKEIFMVDCVSSECSVKYECTLIHTYRFAFMLTTIFFGVVVRFFLPSAQ